MRWLIFLFLSGVSAWLAGISYDRHMIGGVIAFALLSLVSGMIASAFVVKS
jgi:hypothetical protein